MKLRFAFALVVVGVGLSSAAHASQAVAVMPFRDLSGGKGSIGEAIRETVTTDLKDVGGLRVIERANLDKILNEQNLQGNKTDLDPLTTVKVGKLVGATLIVSGAYQKAASSVRLTARFVSVETGEIIGTAKVDGPHSDFLILQDRVTTQLLKSAGIEQRHVEKFAARRRPKMKSLRTIELYGEAVVETDDEKKKQLLQDAVLIDPSFTYASHDLDALEQRMKKYASVAHEAQSQELTQELARIDGDMRSEKDPQKIYMYYTMLFAKLMTGGRWTTLIAVSKRVVANPPPKPPYGGVGLDEMAQMYIVQGYSQTKNTDAMLREGEHFMQKFPTSMYFQSVQMMMNAAINQKRDSEDGVDKAREEIGKLPPAQRNDPCRTGPVYNSNKQFKEAVRDLEACMAAGDHGVVPWLAPFLLVMANMELHHTKEMKKWIDYLHTNYPEQYRNVRHLETMIGE